MSWVCPCGLWCVYVNLISVVCSEVHVDAGLFIKIRWVCLLLHARLTVLPVPRGSLPFTSFFSWLTFFFCSTFMVVTLTSHRLFSSVCTMCLLIECAACFTLSFFLLLCFISPRDIIFHRLCLFVIHNRRFYNSAYIAGSLPFPSLLSLSFSSPRTFPCSCLLSVTLCHRLCCLLS